jgi:hypothetical protein
MEGTRMILQKVRIYRIVWNGNDGEVWYTDAGGAADHLRALLGSVGFRFGTPVARPGGDGALQALPVVKRGCSLTELQDVCRNDPGVEIRTPPPGTRAAAPGHPPDRPAGRGRTAGH